MEIKVWKQSSMVYQLINQTQLEATLRSYDMLPHARHQILQSQKQNK